MTTCAKVLESVVRLASEPLYGISTERAKRISISPRLNLGDMAFSACLDAICEHLQTTNHGGVDDNKLLSLRVEAEKSGYVSLNVRALDSTGFITSQGGHSNTKDDAVKICINIYRTSFKDPWFVERRA